MTIVKFTTLAMDAKSIDEFRNDVVEYLDVCLKIELHIRQLSWTDTAKRCSDYHIGRLEMIRDAFANLTAASK